MVSNELVFERLGGPSEPIVDVVFVHGLRGHHIDTWSCGECAEPEGPCWIDWLYNDLPGVAAYSLGYPTAVFTSMLGEPMTLFERSKNALEHMASFGLGTRPIVFIVHSLGGLLAKQIIHTGRNSSEPSWKAITNSVKAVIFFGTPHEGAPLAKLLSHLLPQAASSHTTFLAAGNVQLTELNDAHRTFCGEQDVSVIAYYETRKTKGVQIVPRESADPGIGGAAIIPADGDHTSICKPTSRDSTVYRSVISRLRPIVAAASLVREAAKGDALESYGDPAEGDRRDLLQKLIDAGREHEYSIANELQNKFAQSYHKLGLHEPARAKHDMLLSELEQRFITHVYHEKICKGAPAEQITSALQVDVIDPVVSRLASESGVTSKMALKAIYFLTERCHIRWDKP